MKQGDVLLQLIVKFALTYDFRKVKMHHDGLTFDRGPHFLVYADYTSQQYFGTRKVYCVSNVTFHAESKYAIKIFPSPTVFVQWPF